MLLGSYVKYDSYINSFKFKVDPYLFYNLQPLLSKVQCPLNALSDQLCIKNGDLNSSFILYHDRWCIC